MKGGVKYAYLTSRDTKRKNFGTKTGDGKKSDRCGYRNFKLPKEAVRIFLIETPI
jgi:hypothetical protein